MWWRKRRSQVSRVICRYPTSPPSRCWGWFPQIRIVLHHLNAGADLPSGVVAVPAFVLDGRVIQYGTPDQAQLSEEIVGALRSRPDASSVEEGES